MFLRFAQTEVDATRGLGALIGAFAGFWYPDIFGPFWIFLGVLMAIDWIQGRRAVRYANPKAWDRKRSTAGLQAKMGTLILLAGVRTFEAFLPRVSGLPEWTGSGVTGTMICLLLIVDEFDSIDNHNVTLGGKHLPLLGTLIRRVRLMTGADQRVRQLEQHPGRRSEDRPAELGGEVDRWGVEPR